MRRRSFACSDHLLSAKWFIQADFQSNKNDNLSKEENGLNNKWLKRIKNKAQNHFFFQYFHSKRFYILRFNCIGMLVVEWWWWDSNLCLMIIRRSYPHIHTVHTNRNESTKKLLSRGDLSTFLQAKGN